MGDVVTMASVTGGRPWPGRGVLERVSGDPAAAGGVRAVVLDDGSERGIRVLEFRTGGGMRFDVLVDRAMDIGLAEFDDLSVGWRSATGFRHPGLHEHNDEDGLSWLRSMSGLVVTAGLDHTLFGGEVGSEQYHYPPRRTVRQGLHGRVANIPARLAGYGERWEGDRCVLWAEGEIHQAAIFAENLVLHRRIEADLGGTEIRLTDTVRNAGFELTPHMFLYHVNVGWPLLEEGSTFDAPIAETLWRSDSVAEQGVSHLVFPGPQPGFVEQVYEHALTPDPDGRQRVRVANAARGRAFELDYDPAAFPAFFEWLNLREGSYAVGLEPSTHHVAGDAAAREDGSMIWLAHGEERRYETVFRFTRAGAGGRRVGRPAAAGPVPRPAACAPPRTWPVPPAPPGSGAAATGTSSPGSSVPPASRVSQAPRIQVTGRASRSAMVATPGSGRTRSASRIPTRGPPPPSRYLISCTDTPSARTGGPARAALRAAYGGGPGTSTIHQINNELHLMNDVDVRGPGP